MIDCIDILKNMIRKLLLFFTSFIPFVLIAQQVPQYTLYAFNPVAFNPAYSGMGNSLEATGVFRKQWLGIEGSPTTQNLNFHMPIYYLRSGVGLNIENDQLGALRNTKIELSYSYHIKTGKSGRLSLGVSGGMLQLALDGAALLAPEGEYDELGLDHNDGLLPDTKMNGLSYTLNAGVFYKMKGLDIGISAKHLTEPTVEYFDNDVNVFSFRRHFLAFASYEISFNKTITLMPAVLFKTDGVQHQADFSAYVTYKDRFLLGLGFRGFNSVTKDALDIAGGLYINRHWQIIYSYDLSLSGLKEVSRGSHEILLKYDLGKEIGKGKLPKIIHNPRLL